MGMRMTPKGGMPPPPEAPTAPLSPFVALFSENSYSDAGSTAAEENDPVQQLNDNSGNDNHLTQATLAKRPLYIPNQINGRPIVRFDGTDDNLIRLFESARTRPNTIYAVAKLRSFNTSVAAFVFDGRTLSTRHALFSNTSNNWTIFSGADMINGAADFDWHIHTSEFRSSAPRGVMRLDGDQTASGDAGSASGGGITIADRYNDDRHTQLDFACLLYYDGAHDAAQIAEVETFLSNTYNLPLAS
jgi:hypothetical protein